jgi:TetR/AcrR family transcriptional regulator, tetracycline repressor protein
MATTREPLTRLRIVKLALEIIDAEGLDSLNMRRLASAAGVKPMSLYHHYPNKEAILLAVAESISAAALGDAASGGPAAGEDLGMPLAARPGPSTAGDWRDQVRLLFVGLYELVQAHPRALPLIGTGVLRTPSGRRWMEELMRVLLEAGFTPDEAASAYHTIGAYTLGLGYAQMLSLEIPPESIVGELTGHWADYPNLLRVGLQLAIWDQPATFAAGLDVLLEDFARRLDGRGR